MLYIDSALVNIAERCCRRFQVLTGRTNVWLAFQLTNLSIVVYFLWAGLTVLRTGGLFRIVLAVFCGGLLFALTQTLFRVSVDSYEGDAYRRLQKGLRNPRRLRDAPLRVAFLTLSVMLFGPVAFATFALRLRLIPLGYSLVVLTTVVLYLLACDPLPPSPGTLREWARTLVPGRLASSETPGD
ncbi:MAG: hypothetical protein AB7G23_19495 [Vicinamibacterales bacterium]